MNNRSNMIKVAVVGGEGIGPEVTAQSQRVLNWFAAKRGVPMTLREAQYGIIPYLATGKVLPRRHRRGDGRGRRHPVGRDRRPGNQGGAGRGAQGGKPAGAAQQIRSLRQFAADRRQSGAGRFRAAEGACAEGRRLRHHPRTDQRHLFRRAARHRNACRRAAPRLQHRAIHHQSDPPRGALGFRTGAHAQEQGLFGRQGQCARDQRAVARGSHRACTRRNFPMSSSPISMSTTPPCRSCASPRNST